ncbi:ATP-binding protein [Salibacter halophilus]|uniref:ATP-binding protein n=1 Tax=Salibacter halophilus TaxID=1803916 RepID=A0A6N6M396_9FLAO|nr:AAA family ATPase [Salibacter halophilus]KAB1063556.1 ATP-binding protein [Salibacter halophilus]
MNLLIEKSKKKLTQLNAKSKRYLYNQIDWTQKLIIIKGYRGAGKTTMVLQKLSESNDKSIYLSLDDFYFETNRLIEVVQKLYKMGYRVFALDEVHRYNWWSKDIKQLYDDYEDINIIATGSSILDIKKGNADLSRRAVLYTLHGMSFREFINFKHNRDFKEIKLYDIIEKHHQLSSDISEQFNFQKTFDEYLEFGVFPFYFESKETYRQKLEETLNLVIDSDITPFEELKYSTVRTMKKLLYVISQSVPFKPNINKLAQKLDTTRNTVLLLLDHLYQAQILNLLKTDTKGISYLQKPEKIYLHNTNLIHLFSAGKANIGNIRETFFFNQLNATQHVVAPKYGDFLVNNQYIFEVGGPSKTNDQIRGLPDAYLALDIKNGNNNRIPLWLFGMLY